MTISDCRSLGFWTRLRAQNDSAVAYSSAVASEYLPCSCGFSIAGVHRGGDTSGGRESLALALLNSRLKKRGMSCGVAEFGGVSVGNLNCLTIHIRVRLLPHANPRPHALSSPLPRTSTMASPQQRKGRDGALATLDVCIQALDIAKDACGIPPVQVALSSASVLLTMIRVRFSVFREDKLLIHVI
jgi:hypothetical protein